MHRQRRWRCGVTLLLMSGGAACGARSGFTDDVPVEANLDAGATDAPSASGSFDATTTNVDASITSDIDAADATIDANLAVDADTVYVAGETDLSDGTLEAVILAVPKTGGAASTIFARTGTYTWLAFADPYVYMTDRLNADVLRVVKNGTDQTTLVETNASQVLDVAVDDACVYWTAFTGATGGVYVAPR